MLVRVDDYFSYLEIADENRDHGLRMAQQYSEISQGMMDVNDYKALAAIALHYKPKRIFEIGTYLGVTSDFFLSILPESEVVSIAYVNPRLRFFGRQSNNSELTKKQIGSSVQVERRSRFKQLFGDSHKLDSGSLINEHGKFDLVLIDGDHTAQGVALDTELSKKIISTSGVICWHDANPKQNYMDVRLFLENELSLSAIATKDNYIGGVAAWSKQIETRLSG